MATNLWVVVVDADWRNGWTKAQTDGVEATATAAASTDKETFIMIMVMAMLAIQKEPKKMDMPLLGMIDDAAIMVRIIPFFFFLGSCLSSSCCEPFIGRWWCVCDVGGAKVGGGAHYFSYYVSNGLILDFTRGKC